MDNTGSCSMASSEGTWGCEWDCGLAAPSAMLHLCGHEARSGSHGRSKRLEAWDVGRGGWEWGWILSIWEWAVTEGEYEQYT